MRKWWRLAKKKKNSTEIVPFTYAATEMNVPLPVNPKGTYIGTCTQIKNAWIDFTYIDDWGIVWINVERVHAILRTSKPIARYEIGRLDDSAKIRCGDKTYVRAYDLRNILDKYIQQEKIGKKKEYLKFSEQIYLAIRDSNDALVIREKYNTYLEDERRMLKRKRIKAYNIKYDELTGDKLLLRTAEFSHIRSYAIYKEISNDIENGLIVNKETHQIITEEGINDEDELQNLCNKRNWNLDWYQKYKKYFNLG